MTEEEIQALQQKLIEATKTNEELVTRVQRLETDNNDLVAQRKELKQKLQDGASDDELKKELDNYKQKMSEIEEEYQAKENEYVSKLANKDMMQQLKELGVEAHNSDALNALSSIILSEAKYEDGSFKFVGEDGTTRFNDANKEYSILDKVNELRGGDKSYLFKPTVGASDDTVTPTAPAKTDINSVLDAGLTY